MNNIKWIKISCDLFDDEVIKVIEKMPEADSIIVIWLKLLISAGKTNDKGFVYFKKEIPYTDEMLSAVFNRPLNTIRLAIKTFEQFGMIEITDEQQIFISNWEKHQNVEGMERVRELAKMRMRKCRAKKQQLLLESNSENDATMRNGCVTVTHIDTEQEQDKEQEEEKEILTHTLTTEDKKEKCVCVELTKSQRKILVDYAKKSNARNVDAYVNTLIQNGAYLEIIERAEEEEKRRIAREQQKKAKEEEERREPSEEEKAQIEKQMAIIRENLKKTGTFRGIKCN